MGRFNGRVARFRNWLPQALLILIARLWAFFPVFSGGWVWDDTIHVTKNGIIQAPDGSWKVWVRTDPQGDYYPLTAFVRWIEWHLWGDDTLDYHLVNIGLHLTSAFLIWRLFFRLGVRLAWLGALLFAIHPITVESVAWITELKNTLSLPPLLLAMLAWLDWKDEGRKHTYYRALAWFVLSMLAKTAGLMLPSSGGILRAGRRFESAICRRAPESWRRSCAIESFAGSHPRVRGRARDRSHAGPGAQ